MSKTLETLKELHIPQDWWETENGINNNKWKNKVHNETLVTTITSQTNNADNNNTFNNTIQDSYIIMLVKIAVIGLGCIK
ncbi:hypothetical protein Glove_19g346 [Diversispora epigaea]|uniref:Uncharacterized protein n=1 Tax=Diversispora epigaea TaxID=1348612 RepID=A0A397JL01_9GLOM|nr:hypothetical protein Glove_19g346 [Diversispora epigaea]